MTRHRGRAIFSLDFYAHIMLSPALMDIEHSDRLVGAYRRVAQAAQCGTYALRADWTTFVQSAEGRACARHSIDSEFFVLFKEMDAEQRTQIINAANAAANRRLGELTQRDHPAPWYTRNPI